MYKYLFLGDAKIQWYNIFNAAGYVVLVIFNCLRFKQKSEFLSLFFIRTQNYFIKELRINTRFRFLKRSLFWAFIEQLLFSAIQTVPALFLSPLFAQIFNTGANYFGILLCIPFILLVFYWLLGTAPCKQSDLLTTAFPLALVFYKLACFCQGCCHGFESKIGLYNYNTYAVEVPVQLVETVCALLIFVFLMLWQKKAKPGTLLPLYTILYCGLRFGSEFLRHEDNVLGPLKTYHLLCIAGFVIGIIEYVLIDRFGEKLDHFILTKNLPVLISNLGIKLKKKKRKPVKKKNKTTNKQNNNPQKNGT